MYRIYIPFNDALLYSILVKETGTEHTLVLCYMLCFSVKLKF